MKQQAYNKSVCTRRSRSSDRTVADSPHWRPHQKQQPSQVRRSGGQHKPASEYCIVPLAAPGGGGVDEPPPTPVSTASVHELRERQKRAAFLAVLEAGHGISLLCERHTMQFRHRLHHGVKRGSHRLMGWPIILGCWYNSQPRRGVVLLVALVPRLLSCCQGPTLQTPVVDLLPPKAA